MSALKILPTRPNQNPASPAIQFGDAGGMSAVTIPITSAMITGTAAGQLGHALGVPLVPDPPAGTLIELISCIVSYKFATAAYANGGNLSVNINGGAAVTGVVSAANSIGAGADKAVELLPLAAAGNVLTPNKGLNLVAAAAFTNPGTAAGTVKCYVMYRVYTL
jgi:hypothetical protein